MDAAYNVVRNEQVNAALDQVIDALSFTCTYIPDGDFRVHSKNTADTVASLQAEQANRIAHAFGGRSPSPQYLAQHLLALYQADAASVSGSGGASSFDSMSDEAVRYFKKEMKQRIHEWEASFAEHVGRDASAQDKAPLRPIYELYKVVKNRALRESGTAAASGPAAATPPSSQHQVPHQSGYPTAVAKISASVASAAVSPAVASSHGAPSIAQSPTTQGGTAPGPPQALVDEKRALKRLLHQFEANFEAEFGRKPGKDDRRLRAREYQRYGELKMLINEQAKHRE